MLVLQGPPGIGKTALLDAAAATASGVSVLRARGGEVERDLGFGLVRELFEPVMRAAPAASRRRWLSGAASAASAVLEDTREGEADIASVTFGLYWLLAAIAEDEPLLLVADDLHACDPASLRWLAYLARRIDGLPVAALAASRPAEPEESVRIDDLLAIPGVGVRVPQPLGLSATSELIARNSGREPADEFAQACQLATGGNPWLLRELLEGARAAGLAPTVESAALVAGLAGGRVRPAVLARIGRLDPASARLARAVAVLGDGCELRHAQGLARIGSAAALAALPALVTAGVLADDQPLGFAHPLLRTAVYLDMPAPVRAAQHQRAAALLHAANADPQAVAHHLLAAEPAGEEWALEVLGECAKTAMARGAPESAAAYLRRALLDRPRREVRAQVLRSLANAMLRLGDKGALGVLEEALELAGSPATRAEIVTAGVDPLVASGRAADARSMLVAVLADGEELDSELELLLFGQLGIVRALDGAGEPQEIARLRSATAEGDASTPARRYAAGALALVEVLCDGTADVAVALARRALAGEAHVDADARSGRPLHVARAALALAGEPQEALRGLERALDVSSARGSIMGQGIGLGWRALIQCLAGNVTGAENDGRASLAILSATGLRGPELGAAGVVAWALIERGEPAEAQDLLDAAPPPYGWGGVALDCVRARLLMARHRHADALAVLGEVEQRAAAAGWRSVAPAEWRSLAAVAALGAGDTARARQLAEEDVAAAERFGSARELGRALRVRGLMTGPADQRTAIECLRGGRSPLELARALVEHGAALRRWGRRTQSREPLHEALELASSNGATALAEHARTELRAAGARHRRVARSGVDALTPSERRVALLAAEGLTNAEIAQALYVTVRTVEMHLSAAYRKLEVLSRASLPAALSG